MTARARALLIGWRLRHVIRRIRQKIAAEAICAVEHNVALHRTPRAAVSWIERRLISGLDHPAFDSEGYLRSNPDVRALGRDALGHYLEHGWAEGRRGGAPDGQMTWAVHPGAPVSPLAAALSVQTLRPPRAEMRTTAPDLPTLETLLDRLEAVGRRPDRGGIDVIVPVYAGRIETLNTLLRVLEAPVAAPFRLVIVDDCGPDPSLRADIARLAARGVCDLVRQPRNLGFVAAINAGMALHPERDAVWLNADTEVYGDWLDRLLRVAESDQRIGTVTPLTSNGTIASYPVFDRDNPHPLEVPWAVVDRLAAEANGDASVDAPTCVGFCVMVRRAAWIEAGALDERTFGRGYGEENDFSCRAAAKGWRNVIAGGVYVRHLGACSFGAEKAERIAPAMQAMERLHPRYHAAVRAYAAADPVAVLRQRIDLARLSRASAPRPVLIVTHRRGGGTERHVTDEIERLRAAGQGAVLMTGGSVADTLALGAPGLATLPGLSALPPDPALLSALLSDLGVDAIAVHHAIEMGKDGPALLRKIASASDLPLEVTMHDYFAVCPRINLAGVSGHYCGEPDAHGCRRCLAAGGTEAGTTDVVSWRRDHGALLRAARRILVPDADVALRLRRYFPDAHAEVVPHETVPTFPPARPRPVRGAARIAVLGAIGPIKGFDVLLKLARQSKSGGPPASFIVIGYTRNDEAARAAGIHVTGPYKDRDVATHIETIDPDVIFIPSTWPETFCYTLSHAMRSGRPVAAFDLGAQGRRLNERSPSGVIPLDLAHKPGALLPRLVAIARRGAGPAPSGSALPESTLAT